MIKTSSLLTVVACLSLGSWLLLLKLARHRINAEMATFEEFVEARCRRSAEHRSDD
jgi:hypothetical protein